MHSSDLGYNNLLVGLYRAAREMPRERFQAWALKRIQPLLRFDAAVWGAGRVVGGAFCVSHAFEFDVDPDALPAWQAIDGDARDKVIALGFANPGKTLQHHAPTLFKGRRYGDIRDYAARFGRQCYLVTEMPGDDAREPQWVSLYRADPDALYETLERLLCESLMPHFAEALRINAAVHAETTGGSARGVGCDAIALADPHGRLHFAQERFLGRLREEWSEFGHDCMLPAELRCLATDAQAEFRGSHVRVSLQRSADMVLLRAHEISALDRLAPRRGCVARLYAEGHSHKEIARQFRISPSTVRNHIKAAYRELGVNSKAQLRALDGGPGRSSK